MAAQADSVQQGSSTGNMCTTRGAPCTALVGLDRDDGLAEVQEALRPGRAQQALHAAEVGGQGDRRRVQGLVLPLQPVVHKAVPRVAPRAALQPHELVGLLSPGVPASRPSAYTLDGATSDIAGRRCDIGKNLRGMKLRPIDAHGSLQPSPGGQAGSEPPERAGAVGARHEPAAHGKLAPRWRGGFGRGGTGARLTQLAQDLVAQVGKALQGGGHEGLQAAQCPGREQREADDECDGHANGSRGQQLDHADVVRTRRMDPCTHPLPVARAMAAGYTVCNVKLTLSCDPCSCLLHHHRVLVRWNPILLTIEHGSFHIELHLASESRLAPVM